MITPKDLLKHAVKETNVEEAVWRECALIAGGGSNATALPAPKKARPLSFGELLRLK